MLRDAATDGSQADALAAEPEVEKDEMYLAVGTSANDGEAVRCSCRACTLTLPAGGR